MAHPLAKSPDRPPAPAPRRPFGVAPPKVPAAYDAQIPAVLVRRAASCLPPATRFVSDPSPLAPAPAPHFPPRYSGETARPPESRTQSRASDESDWTLPRIAHSPALRLHSALIIDLPVSVASFSRFHSAPKAAASLPSQFPARFVREPARPL